MQDELDPQLVTQFAEATQALPDAQFMAAFLAKLRRKARLRILQHAALIAALLIAGAWAAPAVLLHTAAAMQAATGYARPYAPLVVSPLGWAVSTLIGLAVLLRAGVLRRR